MNGHHDNSSVLVTPCHSTEDEALLSALEAAAAAGTRSNRKSSRMMDLAKEALIAPDETWLERVLLTDTEPMDSADWDTLTAAVSQTRFWKIDQRSRAVVRWRGMVQDILEPEYVSTATSNRSSLDGPGTAMTESLSERTPVVMVSIPSCTVWYQEEENAHTPPPVTTATTMSVDCKTTTPKHKETLASDDDRDVKRSKLLNNPSESSSDNESHQPVNNTSNVVLANFYMDQYPKEKPPVVSLKLNQIVEVFGVLEQADDDDDNMLVTDAAKAALEPDAMDIATDTPQSREPQESNDFADDGPSMWEENLAAKILPKHVPRLHIVWFRISSLDDTTSIPSLSSAMTLTNDASTAAMAPEMLSRVLADDQTLSSSNSNSSTNVVAIAVWLLLNSMAERSNTSDDCVVMTPRDTSLGCASLNVVLSSDKTKDRLIHVLQALAPVVQVLNLTADALQSDRAMEAPSRHHHDPRLQQTALQLPAGSVLVVDIRSLCPHKWKPQYVSSRQWANWQTFVQLCREHRIHYTFDGGVRIPFEADYRIIVISNSDICAPAALHVDCAMERCFDRRLRDQSWHWPQQGRHGRQQ